MRVSATFQDVFALGQAAGFDLGFRQLDSGPPSVQADLVSSQRMIFVSMVFERSYHQLGEPPAGMKTFGIPLNPLQKWRGGDYRESSILPFNLPDGIDSVSGPGFAAMTMSVDEECLRNAGSTFSIPVTDTVVSPISEAIIRNGSSTRQLRRLLSQLFDNPAMELDRDTEDEITVALLCAALNDTGLEDKSSPTSRSRAVARALAFIDDCADEPLTVRDICSHTGVSLRTLNRGFRERFGLGPKAYLLRQRLAAVRRDLIRATSGRRVADAANRRGFWHMGQFARDYRRQFHELPRETIRRRPARTAGNDP